MLKPLTALENLHVALQPLHGGYLRDLMLNLSRFLANERKLDEQAHALLTLVGIPDAGKRLASELSYAQQRRLELACALALRPRLLLLDELAAGMNPVEADALMQLIRDLHESRQLTILLIEHNMRVIMKLCQRLQVLQDGRIIAEGAPATLRQTHAWWRPIIWGKTGDG